MSLIDVLQIYDCVDKIRLKFLIMLILTPKGKPTTIISVRR